MKIIANKIPKPILIKKPIIPSIARITIIKKQPEQLQPLSFIILLY
jgi:hypothetical protein